MRAVLSTCLLLASILSPFLAGANPVDPGSKPAPAGDDSTASEDHEHLQNLIGWAKSQGWDVDETEPGGVPRVKRGINTQWFQGSGSDWDMCGSTTYKAETWEWSPLASDCRSLQHEAGAAMGHHVATFGANRSEFVTVASHGTCIFGIRPGPKEHKVYFRYYIGNTDIRDLVRDSIARATHKYKGVERVGMSGVTHCTYMRDYGDVEWRVYGY